MRRDVKCMKSMNIQKVNDAILTLRHFIDLSSRLLPFLYELKTKEKPSSNDLNDSARIQLVYENYSFDTATSVVLMNSPILEIIKSTFQSIIENGANSSQKVLDDFNHEHNRLMDEWAIIDAN